MFSWEEWREGGLRDGREALQKQGIAGYDDLRAAYICERYETMTSHPAPVLGGLITNRDKDREARERISQEQGIALESVNACIGGARQEQNS
ncbi:MAG: hypothetical protein Q8M04_02750 [Pseudomonadota bacterium]|nr:hypothetical protein [Pseudomonadota bacterium]